MEQFRYLSSDGKTQIAAYRSVPEHPRAILQIAHGMTEYFLRYEKFAAHLSGEGILVCGNDHLGHGYTAPTPDDLGFTVSGGGADNFTEDVHNLTLLMKKEYPGLPVILFGHSMGSFIVRAVTEKYAGDYLGAVFCGTGGPDMPAGLGKAMAKLLMLFGGEKKRSRFLANLTFAGYNKEFGKGCDPKAWLTRDEEILRRYTADPLCNYIFTLRAYHDMFTLITRVSRKEWAKSYPKDFPILLISGEADPVGSRGKGVRAVNARLLAAGMTDVTMHLYPGMRHEILNETDNEIVYTEIDEWLNGILG